MKYLPGVRGQVVDYSIGPIRNHYLFPMGLGYIGYRSVFFNPIISGSGFPFPILPDIQQAGDLLTETTFTPNRHKVGLDLF